MPVLANGRQIVILFDGTGNREFEKSSDGNGTGTNVASWREVFLEAGLDSKQIIYVPGPGTTGLLESLKDGDIGIDTMSHLDKIRDATVSGLTGDSVDERVKNAANKVQKAMLDIRDLAIKDGIEIKDSEFNLTVAGFSRGAAEAISFLNVLANDDRFESLRNASINVVLYDTVASTGVPGDNSNPWLDLRIPSDKLSDLKILHLVSNREQRSSFPSTHVLTQEQRSNSETSDSFGLKRWQSENGKIVEIEGLGVHSDIGGGYGDNDNLAKLNFLRSINSFADLGGLNINALPSLKALDALKFNNAEFESGSFKGDAKTVLKLTPNEKGLIEFKLHDSSVNFPLWILPFEGFKRNINTMFTGKFGPEIRNNYFPKVSVKPDE